MNTSLLIDSVAETTAHRDRDDLDRSIASLLLQYLQANSVAVYRLLDKDDTTQVALRLRLDRNDTGNHSPEEASDPFPLTHDPALHECVQRNAAVHCKKTGQRHRTLFPLHGAQGMLGILEIDAPQFVTSRDAGLVGGILRILRNHLALLDYGELDTLTGLLNRKTFETYFEKFRLRATGKTRAGESSWLALLDIDKFKSINDTYGHLFGDEVLLLLSRLMNGNFRGADKLFRFGGEEFVIILDAASENGASIAFERLRTAVEKYEFPQVGRVTISMGSTRITDRDTPTTCIHRADAALYYAKQHGRNNLRDFENLVATGELVASNVDTDVELF